MAIPIITKYLDIHVDYATVLPIIPTNYGQLHLSDWSDTVERSLPRLEKLQYLGLQPGMKFYVIEADYQGHGNNTYCNPVEHFDNWVKLNNEKKLNDQYIILNEFTITKHYHARFRHHGGK